MKHTVFFLLLLCGISLSAQEIIDNKGNRIQSYPVVTTINPAIQGLVNQVSITNLENNIRYMQDLGVRDPVTNKAIALQTQNWLRDKFESYGKLDVSIHYFLHEGDSLSTGNVVAIKKGSEFPNEYILISSHYDHNAGPGADDNASGTAGVLECAKILSQVETKRSILFIPFNCEEYGLVGSFAYAQKCAAENRNILGVFNLDQIGYFKPGTGEIKMGVGYSSLSKNLFDFYFQVANLYLHQVPTFHFIKGDHFNSDNTSFIMHDYASLYISDSEYNADIPCYHKACDTLGNGVNSLDLVVAYVRATLAATAELANGWLPPQNLSAISDLSKVMISWDKTPETSGYKLYKNGTLLAETKEATYEDKEVVTGKGYDYYVKGINATTGVESAPSNTDSIIFTKPLTLPYENDFEENSNGFVIRNGSWVVRNHAYCSVLSNAPVTMGGTSWYFSDNYSNIVDLQWFPIPASTEDISVQFDYNRNIGNSMIGYGYDYLFNTVCYLEITTDRKTWHKLAKFRETSSSQYTWDNFEISLNEYIGNEFVQLRFRFESFGPWTLKSIKQLNIDNFKIDFTYNAIPKYENPFFKEVVIYPNPANGTFNIITHQEKSYEVIVYDISGKIVFQQTEFQDGNIDLSFLQKGSYILKVLNDRHAVAKKIVIQ